MSSIANGESGASARAKINAVINDPEVLALLGVSGTADTIFYFTGVGTGAVAGFTAAGRALVDAADAAEQRATLGGLVVGPASATDTAIVLYDGTSGKLVKAALVTIDSAGNIVAAGGLTAGPATCSSFGIADTNASHYLSIVVGSDLTANRNFTIVTGDAARTITIGGDTTIPIFSQLLTFTGPTVARTFVLPDESASLGFLGIPQNSKSAAYTTIISDSGKCIFHPSSDNNARTFTIDSNANVAYPVGTIIKFKNMAATASTISIASDTMTLLPAGTTGSRTLAQYGEAYAEKIASTAWTITGNSALT